MIDSGQRKVHLVADGKVLGGCYLPIAASTSDEPDTHGPVCRRCQRALEKLVRAVRTIPEALQALHESNG